MIYEFRGNMVLIKRNDNDKRPVLINLALVNVITATKDGTVHFEYDTGCVEFACGTQEQAARIISELCDKYNEWEIGNASVPDGQHEPNAQLPLIPELKKPLAVIIKKSAMACMGHTNYIRRKYPHLLPVKFSDGKTLAQYLDEADDWFRKLEGRDMEMWIRMFSFIQAVSDYKEQNEITDLQEVGGKGSGIYSFLLATNPNFYKFFEDPAGIKKKTGKEYFTTKQRERICKWITDNQGVIKFPIIERDNDGHEYINPAAPQFVYWLSERVDTATGKVTSELRINTNVIDTVFRNYGKITLAELDNIKAAWKEYCDTDNEFIDYQLTSFFDLPIKFLIGLTQSYTPRREYTNSGYVGATIEWSAEMLDKQLGGLEERLAKHKSSARIGGDIMRIRAKLLDVTFAIGIQLKWLVDRPIKYESSVFTFPVNPGYFAPQRTAQRITAAKHE